MSSVQAKEALSRSSYSDYLVFSRAVLGWRKVQLEGDREDRDSYLENYTLSRGSLRFINGSSLKPLTQLSLLCKHVWGSPHGWLTGNKVAGHSVSSLSKKV